MTNRIQLIRNLLNESSCSHILISDIVDVMYVSGFKSSNAAILISKDKSLLLTDFRYKTAAESFCKKNPSWKVIICKESICSSLESIIPQGSTVGFQSSYLTFDNYNDLKRSLKKVGLVPLSSKISDQFIIKTPQEISSMRKAAAIGDSALKEITGSIRSGTTEYDLACKLNRLCGDMGSENPSFETIVLFGPRSALPHGRPGKKTLKTGDFILIDFGCTVNGYCSDMTRTFIMGKANSRQKTFYNIVKDAQEKAKEAARAGIAVNDLDSVARTFIKEAGYDEEFGHALGHGVGLRIHEAPRVSQRSQFILPEDSVVTIEPGIYCPGFGGVRIEDMVVIRKNDARELTHFPRELMEIV